MKSEGVIQKHLQKTECGRFENSGGADWGEWQRESMCRLAGWQPFRRDEGLIIRRCQKD